VTDQAIHTRTNQYLFTGKARELSIPRKPGCGAIHEEQFFGTFLYFPGDNGT
jgi:hypothetical protein